MKKDVLITISGIQSDKDRESDKIELVTSGSYYKKNNKHYLLYDEIFGEQEEVTKNIARFDSDGFHITKSGFTNVDMSFEQNKRNMTNYITPYGSMLLGVDASRVDVVEKDESIQVDIAYFLLFNLVKEIIAKSGDGLQYGGALGHACPASCHWLRCHLDHREFDAITIQCRRRQRVDGHHILHTSLHVDCRIIVDHR